MREREFVSHEDAIAMIPDWVQTLLAANFRAMGVHARAIRGALPLGGRSRRAREQRASSSGDSAFVESGDIGSS